MKQCLKCKQTMPLENFSFDARRNSHVAKCKVCQKQYLADYYLQNKTKLLEYQKTYGQRNKAARAKRDRIRYDQTRETRLRKRKQYYESNTLEQLLKASIYRNSIKCGVRPPTLDLLTIVGLPSLQDLDAHLISTALSNYGAWSVHHKYDIDHRIPYKTAKTTEDIVALNHYTNLQLLYPTDNNKKYSKLDWKLK